MKKTLAVLLGILLMMSLTSCGKDEKDVSEDGTMLYLTMDRLESGEREGYYILNRDNTFTPLMHEESGYQGMIAEEDPNEMASRYIWWTNNLCDIDSLIPVVTKDTPLVCYFSLTSHMPEEMTLEKYEDRGYTVGCHFYKEGDAIYMSTGGTLNNTYAQQTLLKIDEEDTFRLQTVNGSNILPVNNVDNNLEMLLGLEKNGRYEFQFYKGTQYLTMNTIADARVLQAERLIVISNPYTKTKNGYFYINLPDNLEEGYYYFQGKGLFRFER